MKILKFIIIIAVVINFSIFSYGSIDQYNSVVENHIIELMNEYKTPGVALGIIIGDQVFFKHYGYADQKNNVINSHDIPFNITDCKSGFIALELLKLEEENRITLTEPVTNYLPWLILQYNGRKVTLTLEQLIQHTSGLNINIYSYYLHDDPVKTLKEMISNGNGISLAFKPGKQYSYNFFNYEILKLVIEKVTEQPFNEYMSSRLMTLNSICPLSGKKETRSASKITGYQKIFFTPKEYHVPPLILKNSAKYTPVTGEQLICWLKMQMGLIEHNDVRLIEKSHRINNSAPIDEVNLFAYTYGWKVSLRGDGIIYNTGSDLNSSLFIGFSKQKKTGIYVFSDVDNSGTTRIGKYLLSTFTDQEVSLLVENRFDYDRFFSCVCIGSGAASLLLLIFLSYIITDVLRKKREIIPFTMRNFSSLAIILFLYCCLGYGLYIFPQAMENINFNTALIILPCSFKACCLLFPAACLFSIVVFTVVMMLPHKNYLINKIPVLVGLALVAGTANALMIFIVNNSIFNKQYLLYLLYAFLLVLVIYILSSKVGQTATIKLTNLTVLHLRLKIFDKIFGTDYLQFEKVDRGKILAVLTNDINTISGNLYITIRFVSSVISVVMIFVYLTTISLWANLLTFSIIIGFVIFNYLTVKRYYYYFEKVRDISNNFLSLLDGLLNGFKEIVLHKKKKAEYRNDLKSVTDEYCRMNNTANIKFVNVNLIAESVIIIVIAFVCFAFPRIFPEMRSNILVNFIMALLYLVSPMTVIVNSLPNMMRLKVSWDRIQQFMLGIPGAPADFSRKTVRSIDTHVEHIKVESVSFSYECQNGERPFTVGPISVTAQKGEITFVIGGNGSGKTTFAKILTGLYPYQQGQITINGHPIKSEDIGEYFSVVFADFYLFKKLYDVNTADKRATVDKWLKLFHLESKVAVESNSFSTIDLSGGQRKRLALLRCYLEDKPIFLFDEWAADQDPEFRRFFYRTMLPDMKKAGKIVIAITHDDHYFDVADRIIKFNMGSIEYIKQ